MLPELMVVNIKMVVMKGKRVNYCDLKSLSEFRNLLFLLGCRA